MFYALNFSFIVGILLGSLLPVILPTTVLVFVLISLLTIVVLIREPTVFRISTCVLLFLIGLWRYQSVQPKNISVWIQSLNDGPEVVLVGQIVADPERVGSVQRLEVGYLELEGEPRVFKGKVLLSAHRYPKYHYGDEIRITGKLKTPPEFEDFSYRDYLATRRIYSLINRPKIALLSSNNGSRTYTTLLKFRHLLEEKISPILPEPESSLLAGVVLGVKRNLPPDFYESLQKSGTLHVIVVSGTNITYVVAFLAAFFGFLTRPLRIILSALGILAYALMVGGGAAVWRATLMGLVTLLAIVFGRRRWLKEALFLSAAVLLLANPMGLWQIGFQLSFAATAGIIFLQDVIDRRLQDWPHRIREGLVTTLAAQIAVLPIIAQNFQTVSVISPLTNLLTFLLIPPLTIGGAVVAFIALVCLPLGRIVAPLVYVLAKLFVVIVETSAKVPFAQVEVTKLPVLAWVGYYFILAAVAHRSQGLSTDDQQC